jgi:hypothetical protein
VHVLSDSLLSDERGEFAIPSYMQPAPAVGGAKSSRDLWRKGGGLATGGFASVVQQAVSERQRAHADMTKTPRQRHHDLLMSLCEQGKTAETREGTPPGY